MKIIISLIVKNNLIFVSSLLDIWGKKNCLYILKKVLRHTGKKEGADSAILYILYTNSLYFLYIIRISSLDSLPR